MREILFRGKVKNTNEWQYGDLRHWTKKSVGIHHQELHTTLRVIPETVGQYTGLTDKNGTKIFEGDILKSDDLYEEPLSVIFNENCGAFQVLFKDGYSDGFLEQYTDIRHIEVIGNIHDNPELLGGE